MKEIPLSKGKVALVDDEDYDRLMAIGKWYCSPQGYAVKNIQIGSYRRGEKKKYKRLHMHRVVINAPDNMQVDHKFGDKLDNRKKNLRLCTASQNQGNSATGKNNTSGYKGVVWHKKAGKWRGKIGIRGKSIHLGLFETAIEAAKTYNAASLEHYGGFARLNDV